MRTLYTYLFFLLLLSLSCTSEIDEKGENTNGGALKPWAPYILFTTDVQTKATALSSLNNTEFGIMAYNYSKTTTWNVAKVQASPISDWGHNLKVACNSAGVCSYNNGEPYVWGLEQNYSFFAYHPYTDRNGVEVVTTQSSLGTPYLKYTSPFDASPVDPEHMIDLMTASAKDLSGTRSAYVDLHFEHRLFCFEVMAQNYNTDQVETISNLSITINNLKYSDMTISLDASEGVEATKTSRSGAVTFTLLSDGESVTVDNFNNIKGKAVSLSGVNRENTLMLIPQDCSAEALTGSLKFTCNGETKIEEFSSSTNFVEGVKYNLVMSFTGNSITIAIIEADQWDRISVDIEFE